LFGDGDDDAAPVLANRNVIWVAAESDLLDKLAGFLIDDV
jgi:hypothetical protein